jgi:menaquinone-dependent protoporphyrinogen oxidase
MTDRVLVAWATKRGSTREVAESVAGVLHDEGFEVECRPAAEVDEVSRYGGVVIGGALYMGRWHRDARRFLARHRASLATLPVAVFGMGPGTLEPRDVESSRKQLDRALAAVSQVEPVAVAVFGGVVDPAKLTFPFNRMPATDARDWEAIRAWARGVATELRERAAVSVA